jgi:hypothetical protein
VLTITDTVAAILAKGGARCRRHDVQAGIPGGEDSLAITPSLAATGSQGICPVSALLRAKGDA